MGEGNSNYKSIFQTTFVFGFVQIFNIVVKVVLNKIVAILLGAEGMGVIGIYHSAINLIKTGSGLGISQSAVRDISEANTCGDYDRFSRIISVTNRVIIFTAILGVIITIAFSPLLSKWYFGNQAYTIAFIWISVVVALNILSEGQLAILKGMRQLRGLAKASIWGSLVGLLVAIPFYYFYHSGGIVPSLIITAFASLFFSNLYVRKIKYTRIKLAIKEVWNSAKPMVKMGIALMLVSFISALFDMIIAAYISNTGSLTDVGYYNAGSTIITGYFGIVITSMSTDYYPRISAVYNDNEKLTAEMNRQSETGLIMVYPLVVLFVFLSPIFIDLLYSKEFVETNKYTDYAIIGTVIIVVSNCMGMILLAKQSSKVFIWSVIIQRSVLIGIYMVGYKTLGLMGLGLAYICTGIIHLVFMVYILNHYYRIGLSSKVKKLLIIVITTTVISIFVRKIDIIFLRYLLGGIVFFATALFSLLYVKKSMNINIIKEAQQRFRRK